MRENMGLFRGKLKSSKEWAFGNLRVMKSGVAIITPDDTLIGTYGQVYPSTVGECTGLKDKNGKLIFEGDIVKGSNILHSNRKIYQVAFDDGSFELFDHKGVGWHHSHIDNKEVIGNFHDNPELLKGESK